LDELTSLVFLTNYVLPDILAESNLNLSDISIMSSAALFVTILTDITRPIDHYLLCIIMYYAWRMRKFFLYAAIVMAHIALGFTLITIWDRSLFGVYTPILAVSHFHHPIVPGDIVDSRHCDTLSCKRGGGGGLDARALNARQPPTANAWSGHDANGNLACHFF
jgi:hypothetical protein